MALWPFRRKSGRKRTRSGAALSDVEGPPPRSQTADDANPATTAHRRTPSQKKQRTETEPAPAPTPAKLHRRPRTYSFSPGRHDSIRVAGKGTSAHAAAGRGKRFSPGDQIDEEKEEDSQWQRVPTLHNTRNGEKLPRRKSSKRRREDHDREAEIKAMSNFVPIRPSAEAWTAGRPMKKESKRVKTTGRNSVPVSEVSLPIPESIHSSMSSDSEHASYKISALEALAPRPTLRYTTHPRWGPNNSSDPTRTSSQKKKLAERASLSEATLKSHKRIDSLADDLGAADLRELMERDNRRRERKRQREQERTERRLTRRAEKQREAEAEAAKSGTPPPQNLERGVMGRDVVGLGIDTTSAVVTSSRRRASDDSLKQKTPSPEQRLSPEGQSSSEDAPVENHSEVLNHFHRTTSIPLEAAPEVQEEVVAPATPPPENPKRSSFLRSKKSRSRTSLASDEKHRLSPMASKTEEYDPPRKDSESSSRGKLTFSSLFKWGSRGNRRSSGPSSFSNTSREEMQAAIQAQGLVPTQSAQQAQTASRTSLSSTPPPVTAFTPTKMSSGVPKRTRSRFREDLPELPMSPPDSRVASPEAEPPLPALDERLSREHSQEEVPTVPVRYDTPSSERRTIDETMRQTPTSGQQNQHSPQPHSVSLASIGSEASWLSGRMAKRSSSGMGMRDSNPRYPYAQRRQSHQSSGNNTEEEIADDEYLSNLATPPQESNMAQVPHGRRSTGDGRPSSDEDESMTDADMKWGSVGARQPVMHRQNAARVKSSEGLLNTFDEESNSSGDLIETPQVENARSVSYGKKGHVRHMSAGSAKLLDITPRASIDSKGRSPASGERRQSVPFSF
ncbi:hypothetical protein ACHAQA_007108 [Verticillium albo-atrum]